LYEFLGEDITINDLNLYQKHKANWLQKNKEYSPATKRTYWVLINNNICSMEKILDKDLHVFSEENIKVVLNRVDNMKTATILKSIISSYINSKSIRNIEIKPNIKYQSLDEFYKQIEKLRCSVVDKMILVLARYGVSTQYITNIKWYQVDKDNMILNLNDKIALSIDKNFIEYLDRTYKCNLYDYKTSTLNYIDKGYIIKVSDKTETNTLNRDSLYTRVKALSNNNGLTKISLRELNSYRQYDLLFDVLNQKGKVNYDDVKEVLKILYGNSTKNKAQYLKERFDIISQQ
jgi:hypothetical protein